MKPFEVGGKELTCTASEYLFHGSLGSEEGYGDGNERIIGAGAGKNCHHLCWAEEERCIIERRSGIFSSRQGKMFLCRYRPVSTLPYSWMDVRQAWLRNCG